MGQGGGGEGGNISIACEERTETRDRAINLVLQTHLGKLTLMRCREAGSGGG